LLIADSWNKSDMMRRKQSQSTINYELLTIPRSGFSILEIVLAMGLFAIIVVGAVSVVTQAFSSVRLGEEETKATFLAAEGLEAVRAIQERDFWSLVPGTYGVSNTEGYWDFSGAQDELGKYTREIIVSDIYRDGSGNIVESGGTLDLYTKRVTARVTWDFSAVRQNEVSLPSYFTYWEAPLCYWDSGSVVATLDLPGDGDGTAVSVVGDRAYVTTMRNPPFSGEFFVIDIANPTFPSILGTLSVRDHVNDLDVSGNYVYLATADSDKELIVVDVSNPASPVEASSFDIPGASQANDVSVEGSYAYVVTQSVADGPELRIFDVSNPLSPILSGGFEAGSHVYGVKAHNQRVYLATSRVDKELIVVDVSSPEAPAELGSYDAPLAGANGQAVDVIRAGVAYLVTRANGGGIPELYLLAVADPSQISLIGSYDISDRANGVAAWIGFALLATEKDGEEFMILDLSDPGTPAKAFSANLNGAAGGVALPEEECAAFFVSANDDAEFQVVQP
jgi:type II secretory pathway pseudopilin PulG